ncbi:MarR family transcriptional regulator [Bacillus sp. JJ664]
MVNKKVLKEAGEIMKAIVSVNNALIPFTKNISMKLNITAPQLEILSVIQYHGASTLKSVVEQLSLPKSTVSVNVEQLVQQGLIERKQSTEDRREVQLTTTVKGSKIAQQAVVENNAYDVIMQTVEDISNDDLKKLLEFHEKLLNLLKEASPK